MTRTSNTTNQASATAPRFLDIAKEEFWMVAGLFFAPVIGTWLLLARHVSSIRDGEGVSQGAAADFKSIPAE